MTFRVLNTPLDAEIAFRRIQLLWGTNLSHEKKEAARLEQLLDQYEEKCLAVVLNEDNA